MHRTNVAEAFVYMGAVVIKCRKVLIMPPMCKIQTVPVLKTQMAMFHLL